MYQKIKITRSSHGFLTLRVQPDKSVVSNRHQVGWSRTDMRWVHDYRVFMSTYWASGWVSWRTLEVLCSWGITLTLSDQILIIMRINVMYFDAHFMTDIFCWLRTSTLERNESKCSQKWPSTNTKPHFHLHKLDNIHASTGGRLIKISFSDFMPFSPHFLKTHSARFVWETSYKNLLV